MGRPRRDRAHTLEQRKARLAGMPSHFGLSKLNPAIQPPADPRIALQQTQGFLALVDAELKGGVLKEVHAYLEADRGYFLTGDHSAKKILRTLSAWSPWVTFELHQTVKFPKPIEISIGIAKQRVAMTKWATARSPSRGQSRRQ